MTKFNDYLDAVKKIKNEFFEVLSDYLIFEDFELYYTPLAELNCMNIYSSYIDHLNLNDFDKKELLEDLFKLGIESIHFFEKKEHKYAHNSQLSEYGTHIVYDDFGVRHIDWRYYDYKINKVEIFHKQEWSKVFE